MNRIKNIKKGAVIMILGVLGLVFTLSNTNMSMIEKVPISVVCIGIMLIGAFLESPLMESFRGDREVDEDFS